MIKYIVAALLLLVGYAQAAVIVPVKTPVEAVVVKEISQVSRRENPFGVVEGIEPCDPPSAGVIVQVRLTDCTRVPCHMASGNSYSMEIDFEPRDTHTSLNLLVTLLFLGEEYTIIDGNVPGSGVEAGGRYTFTYPILVEGFILGYSDIRVEIAGATSGLVEVCSLASVIITD